ETVRASDRRARLDTGGTNRTIPLRHRVRTARFAAGAGGRVSGKSWIEGRCAPSLLLSLRPDDRSLRSRDHAHRAYRRCRHGVRVFDAVKYGRRWPTSVGARIHGGMLLEVAWTVIPLRITLGIFVWGASVFFAMSSPRPEAENIYVVGKQWMWKFQHLDGQRE